MAFSISYIYQLVDKYTKPIDKIVHKTVKLERKINKSQKALKKFSTQATTAQNALSTVAIGAAALFPVKQAITFEAVMADVKKVIDLTDDQAKTLKKSIMKNSLAMGRLPADIARIAEAGGRLKIPIDKMDQFIGVVSRTSVAFDMLEATAGDSIASLRNKLKLTIDETESLMDAINFLADNTAAKGGNMIEVIARTAGVMSTIKMPKAFIAGWAAFADQVEVTPQLAASGLKMMINRMKMMPGMMDKLLKDPHKTMREYLGKFQAMDAAKRAPLLLKKFGQEAGKFAELAVNRLDLLDETMGLVADKTKFTGSMMKELQKKFATSEFQIARVKAMFTILAITIGNSVLPVIQSLIPIIIKISKVFNKFAEAHPQLMKFMIIGGILIALLGSTIVALGLMAGAVSFLLPIFAALASVIGGVSFFAGLMGITFAAVAGTVGVFIAGLAGLVAIFKLVWENISTIMDLGFGATVQIWIDMFTDLYKAIERISLEGLTTAFKWWKDVLGFDGKTSVTAEKNINTQGSLSGKIDIGTTGNATVEKATMETDMPGELGFNMGN